MADNEERADYLTGGMSWVARILGMLASVPFLLFLVDTLAGAQIRLSWASPQGAPLLVALALATAGAVLAWRWQMIGGLMIVVCSLAVVVLAFVGSGTAVLLPAVMLSVPFLIAGALHLGCCWRTRLQLR